MHWTKKKAKPWKLHRVIARDYSNQLIWWPVKKYANFGIDCELITVRMGREKSSALLANRTASVDSVSSGASCTTPPCLRSIHHAVAKCSSESLETAPSLERIIILPIRWLYIGSRFQCTCRDTDIDSDTESEWSPHCLLGSQASQPRPHQSPCEMYPTR